MLPPTIHLRQKFNEFEEYWTPKILGEFNGQLIKIAKLKGEFMWHKHDQEDELFYIVKGELLMRYKEQDLFLHEGDLHIVPKGTNHLPIAEKECWVMLIEPKGTKHTGENITDKTVAETHQQWI